MEEETGPMAAARICATSAAILGGQAGYRGVGGPWWAEFALAALVLLAMCLRIVFPQESADKLAWWRDRRRARRDGQQRTVRRWREPAAEEASAHEQAPARTARRGLPRDLRDVLAGFAPPPSQPSPR